MSFQVYQAQGLRIFTGDTETVSSYVGNAGEIAINTETKSVRVLDGINAGGTPLTNVDAEELTGLNLGQLADLAITEPNEGDTLVFKEGSWKNDRLVDATAAIDEVGKMADVELTNLQTGNVLTYNASLGKWVNQATASAYHDHDDRYQAKGNYLTDTSNLGEMSNVQITMPEQGQSLVYDADYQKWINTTLAAVASGASGSAGSGGFGGCVLQVKHEYYSNSASTSSSSWSDAQTVSFTPKSANSKILIQINYFVEGQGAVALFRDGTAISPDGTNHNYMFWQSNATIGGWDSGTERQTMSLMAADSPNTTDPVEYKTKISCYNVVFGVNGTPVQFGNAAGKFSSMTIWEIGDESELGGGGSIEPPSVIFAASHSTAAYYNGNIMGPWIIRHHNGDCFDTNGTFTAPKAGVYRFDYHNNHDDADGGDQYIDWVYNGANLGYSRIYGHHSGGWENMSGHLIIELTQGDTIQLRGNANIRPDGAHYSFWSGYLMHDPAVSSGGGVDGITSVDSKIGIGTDSPSAKLSVLDGGQSIVSSDANGYARFTHQNGSAQIGLFREGSDVGGGYIGADNSCVLRVFDSSFNVRMQVKSDSRIGLYGSYGGTTFGPQNQWYCHFTTDLPIYHFDREVQAATFTSYSDERLKENIAVVENAVESLKKIRGVNFTWKKDVDSQKRPEGKMFGVLAQEVLKIDSEMCREPHSVIDGDEAFYSFDYTNLTPYFVEAIKEQQTTIESQQAKIDGLEARLVALEAKLG